MFNYNQRYGISEMKLEGATMEFEQGYFIVVSDGHSKSWSGILSGVSDSKELNLFNLPDGDCEIITDEGDCFTGNIIVDKFNLDPTGSVLEFQGNGALVARK